MRTIVHKPREHIANREASECPQPESRPLRRVHISEFTPPRFGGVPVVVLKPLTPWRALGRWCPSYFEGFDSIVPVRNVHGVPRNVEQRHQVVSMPMRDYVGWLKNVLPALEQIVASYSRLDEQIQAMTHLNAFAQTFALDVPLAHLSPSLLQDIDMPEWYSYSPSAVMFWSSILGNSCGLHFDVMPNCNVQIIGRKHFVLYPPTDSSRLYPRDGRVSNCWYDPNEADFARFPKARAAHPWTCILEPGEAIYIPPGWYHQVTVLSAWAVNVNFWWRSPVATMLATPVLRGFLLRRGIARSLQGWRARR